MLKDALNSLKATQGKQQLCKLGRLVIDLEDDESQLLIDILRSDVSTMNLVRTLKSEGISLSREFLGEKRNCFKDDDEARTCCIAERLKK
jgi:hypothetical protein